jgi:rubredoxin
MKTFQCVVCGFVYEEAAGIPSEGIAAGTLWADVPDTWTCPDCGVGKSDFEMIEI